jgi:hypothetical protein
VWFLGENKNMAIDLEKLKVNEFKNEKQFQAAAMKLISQEFPRIRNTVWHTENEEWKRKLAIFENNVWRVETDAEFEKRKMIEGGQSKAQGLKAGMMDILIQFNGVLYRIELKQPNGRLSCSSSGSYGL